MKQRDALWMSDKVNHVMNRELYANAERAALRVYAGSSEEDPERRGRLMEKTARAVLRKAGTPADAAALYAMSICCDIFERVRNANQMKASDAQLLRTPPKSRTRRQSQRRDLSRLVRPKGLRNETTAGES
jgi:hypothetical protein